MGGSSPPPPLTATSSKSTGPCRARCCRLPAVGVHMDGNVDRYTSPAGAAAAPLVAVRAVARKGENNAEDFPVLPPVNAKRWGDAGPPAEDGDCWPSSPGHGLGDPLRDRPGFIGCSGLVMGGMSNGGGANDAKNDPSVSTSGVHLARTMDMVDDSSARAACGSNTFIGSGRLGGDPFARSCRVCSRLRYRSAYTSTANDSADRDVVCRYTSSSSRRCSSWSSGNRFSRWLITPWWNSM